MKKFKVLFAFLILNISCNFLFAQAASDEHQACNPEFARTLVEQQVSESRSVAETDKRIKILTRSADFLWKFDEPTARKFLTEAFQVASDRFKEKGFEEKKLGDQERGLTTRLPDYRFEVIRAISAKDGEWAKRLSEQILAEYEKSAEDKNRKHNETREIQDLIRIAQDNVKTNPELSWYLFRRVMRYPLDYHWYFAVFAAAKEDPRFADALYQELLRNYAGETPRRLLFLSAYPFVNQRIFGIDKYQFGYSVPDNIAPNTNLQRQFIENFFRRIAVFADTPDDINRAPDQYRQPEAVYMVTALQDIEPVVTQRFPDMLQRLSIAKAQANSLMNEENRKKLTDREKQNEDLGLGFEGRLKRLKEAEEKGELTDAMIINLVTWGSKTEEQFELVEPWIDKIKDEKGRRESRNYFYFQRSKLAIKENRMDDAREFARKVPEIEHRAILFFEIATEQLKNVNEASRVFDTLNEVSKLARQAENSVAKAQVLLGLATMYEKVNHTAALGELEEAIRIINVLENPDIFSTSVYRQVIVKDFAFYAVFSTPGYNMEKTFEDISKNDFELSLSHAKSLNDKYFRTLAVLALAKNCVEMKPEKKPARR